MKLAAFTLALVLLGGTGTVWGAEASVFEKAGIDPRLGAELPLDLELTDSSGALVRLDDLIGPRPVVLTLVYYECPMLCSLVLDGLVETLRTLPLEVGKEFDVLTVSFDPGETPPLAAAAKQRVLERYGKPEAAAGWRFLTGDASAVRELTAAAGFRAAYDPAIDQYAHAAAILVVSPEGRISRYLYGVEFPARDLRLSLVEASKNRIGTLTDQLLLLCYHYDPVTGKYGPIALGSIRAGGALTVLGMGGFVFVMLRRERKGRTV